MASHSLSIAKASLLAACLRPDGPKVTRDDLADLHKCLELTLSQCSPSNIQNTKKWLIQNVTSSANRTTAFCKYLVNLSKNIAALPNENSHVHDCRRRLHMLYVLNDVLHHLKYHTSDSHTLRHVQEQLAASLPELFANAAVSERARTIRRLQQLAELWEQDQLCDKKTVARIRDALVSGKVSSVTEPQIEAKASRDLPWIMPATHGDPTAPFFDLPAANLMPHILPNSTKAMRPDRIHPLQLTPGPADESLVNAVKDFLKDVESIEDPYAILETEGITADLDEMGQISYRNEADDVLGDTYYGWSRAFCEKMKTRGQYSGRDSRARSPSSGSSRSSSRSPRKRRRYTSSRSRSSSRTHDKPSDRPTSRSRMSSPPRFEQKGTFHPRSDRPSVGFQQHPPPSIYSQAQSQPPHAPPFSPSVNMHNGFAPPKPPNWNGPWPPPPPPPPGSIPFSGPQSYDRSGDHGR